MKVMTLKRVQVAEQLLSFLDALASLDFTLVSESVGRSFEFEIDLKC